MAIIGMSSIALALVLLGLLSQRLGRVTGSGGYYVGLFVAAALVAVGAVMRIVALWRDLDDNMLSTLLFNGAPAAGVTLGVIICWRYWSWLLAERS